MTTLHLVRHGPTGAGVIAGWTDIPAILDDKDRLARLEACLPSGAVVVSSDLSRAAATADAIQGERRRLPDNRELRELNFGDWENRTWDEIEGAYPDIARAFLESPGACHPPGGESWEGFRNRCDAAIDSIVAAHPEGNVVAICHFGVIVAQVQRAGELDAETAFQHRIDYLSVTELVARPSPPNSGMAPSLTLARLNFQP